MKCSGCKLDVIRTRTSWAVSGQAGAAVRYGVYCSACFLAIVDSHGAGVLRRTMATLPGADAEAIKTINNVLGRA